MVTVMRYGNKLDIFSPIYRKTILLKDSHQPVDALKVATELGDSPYFIRVINPHEDTIGIYHNTTRTPIATYHNRTRKWEIHVPCRMDDLKQLMQEQKGGFGNATQF